MKTRIKTSITARFGKTFIQALAMSVALAAGSPAVSAQDQDVSEITAAMNGMMLATLEASYTVTYHQSEEHWITRDDIYYQKDLATIGYGFQFVAGKEPDIIRKGDKCILTATVRNSPFRIQNRQTLVLVSADEGMQLKDDDGRHVDVDRILNKKVEEEERKFRAEHMEIAKSNLKQFFGIYAAKIGCVPKLEFVK